MTIAATHRCQYPGCEIPLEPRPGRGGSPRKWCDTHRWTGPAAKRPETRASRTGQPRKRYPKKKAATKLRPWCGIDTEGVTDTEGRWGPVGRHYPMVVTAAAEDGFEHWLYLGRPLWTGEILRWLLWSLPRKQYAFCGFFFGYDQSMILHTTPEDVLRKLYRSDEPWTGRTPPQTSIIGPYVVDRFNTKITIVKPWPAVTEVPDDMRQVRGPRIDVWDVGKFFNKSFASVLDDYPDLVSPDEAAFVTRMKAQRADFDPAYWDDNADEIVRYSLLENRLLARIQAQFDGDADDQGYPLRNWYGAGSLAKSMLDHEGVTAHLQAATPIPTEMREPVDWSYFGGRFEIREPGPIAADVWEHDISSAYPASYRDLPCRVHGTWVHRRTRPKDPQEQDLLRVKWNVLGSRFGPFPMRAKDHSICYPYQGEGWYWGYEVLPALALWDSRAISVREGWVHRRNCECLLPFGWIHKPYARRLALGKNSAGYSLKIGMNACYGTLLSPLSDKRWDAVWGAMITSYCRGQLLTAMALASSLDAVVMLATDAVYATERLAVPEDPVAKALGTWEVDNVGPGLLIQPGLYHFPRQGRQPKLKTRGISQQDVLDNIDLFYRAWEADGDKGTVNLRIRPRFIGIRNALHRNKLAAVGWRWSEDETRSISFNPAHKRMRTEFGWMPPPPPLQPWPYHRFLATWEPERYRNVEEDVPDPINLLADQEMPGGEYT